MVLMENIAIIIPSLDPDEQLLKLLKTIRNKEQNKSPIIIVDDGSPKEYNQYFLEASRFENIIILNHTQNYGKGRALKTAFNHIINELPYVKAAITIDSDGQHTYEDMVKCVMKFEEHPEAIIFGSRNFEEGESVPRKSKFGNQMTSNILQSFTGEKLKDTQTGLRVIPFKYLEPLLDIEGERFEYEMNMIFFARKNDIDIIETPIEIIYYDDNSGTHFHAVRDSIKVYGTFIKYLLSSLSSFLIDIGVFTLIITLLGNESFNAITTSTIIGRVVSSGANYLLNRYIVFKENSNQSAMKYFSLVIIQLLLSSIFVTAFTNIFTPLHPTIIKVIVDSGLFLLSYYLQKRFIFNRRGIYK